MLIFLAQSLRQVYLTKLELRFIKTFSAAVGHRTTVTESIVHKSRALVSEEVNDGLMAIRERPLRVAVTALLARSNGAGFSTAIPIVIKRASIGRALAPVRASRCPFTQGLSPTAYPVTVTTATSGPVLAFPIAVCLTCGGGVA